MNVNQSNYELVIKHKSDSEFIIISENKNQLKWVQTENSSGLKLFLERRLYFCHLLSQFVFLFTLFGSLLIEGLFVCFRLKHNQIVRKSNKWTKNSCDYQSISKTIRHQLSAERWYNQIITKTLIDISIWREYPPISGLSFGPTLTRNDFRTTNEKESHRSEQCSSSLKS